MTFAQIHITPYVPDDIPDMSKNAINILEGKLATIISQSGGISNMGDSRFVLTAKATPISKQALSTVPVKVVTKFNLQMALGDGMNGNCYASQRFEITGVGTTEQQALVQAIGKLNMRDRALTEMVERGKAKIIDYYNKNATKIIAQAKSLIGQQRFEEAVYELSQIPQECNAYGTAQGLMMKAASAKIDQESAAALNEAMASWSASPTTENAENVSAILAKVNPAASCYPQAVQLMRKIEQNAKLERTREHNLQVQMINSATQLQKARIKAAENIAVAYARSRPRVVYHVRSWW